MDLIATLIVLVIAWMVLIAPAVAVIVAGVVRLREQQEAPRYKRSLN